jgi:predicted MFS family arabinose efflux permease
VAGALIWRSFHETVERRTHRVDYLGAGLLTSGMTLVILGVLEGGQAWAWASPVSIAVFVAGAVLLGGFVLAERRAAEPVLPLWVLSRRLLATTTFLALGIGVILIGLTSYVPTYLENSLGVGPLVAGLALAALTLGWPIAATLSGRLFYLRLGFRPTILIGMGLVVVGAATLAAFAQQPSVPVVAVACFVTGMGMGLVATPSLIAAQASVSWDERGVATGANMFARSIGSAVGAAVLGAVANAVVASSGGRETDPGVATDAGTAVFVAVVVAAVLTVVAGVVMPKVHADAGDGGTAGATADRDPEAVPAEA